tara:strand:+ start:53 stop:241 length:189 start_codon:yes stop_codon:yes gene_type:complete
MAKELKLLKLTEKELNLLIDGLYARFDVETLEKNPESLASKLMDKLCEEKGWFILNGKILHK